MLKHLRKSYYSAGAAISAGLVLASNSAHATDGGGGNNFGDISRNVTESIADVPGLISALSYLFGILLGVLGIMKIKDHVENPTNTPLKDGAIRLAAGGALLALPIVFEAMFETVGQGEAVAPATLNRVEFNVQ